MLHALAGEGNIVVLCSTHHQARQTRNNLKMQFPKAVLHAVRWDDLERLQGLTDVLFLVTEELPPDIMAQIASYGERIIYL